MQNNFFSSSSATSSKTCFSLENSTALRCRIAGQHTVREIVDHYLRQAQESRHSPNKTSSENTADEVKVQVALCHHQSHSDLAEEHVKKHLSLPINRGVNQPVRATLVTFADGVADLIVISADPDTSYSELQLLAQNIVTVQPVTYKQASPSLFMDMTVVKVPGFGSPVMSWAKLEQGHSAGSRYVTSQSKARQHQVFIPGDAKLSTLLIAMARVLTVFYGESAPAIAGAEYILNVAQNHKQADNKLKLLSLAVPQVEQSTGGLTQQANELLQTWRSAPVYGRDKLDTAAVSIGLFWVSEAQQKSEFLPEQHYYPYLAPPLPLSIEARPSVSGTSLTFHFDTAYYDLAGVENLAGCVAHVASQLTSETLTSEVSLCCSSLSLTEIAEKDAGTAPSDSRAVTTSGVSEDAGLRIETVFAEQVNRDPDAVALTIEDQHISYGELQRQVNQFTRTLQEIGIQQGDKVGICVMRSPQMIALMLATLHVGAVYVPMDPSYPVERLQYTVSDASMAVVIGECPPCADTRITSLDDFITLSAGQSDRPVCSSALDSGDAAYMIYTSGSSGKPKGVMVPHHNVISLLSATQGNFALHSKDVWTLFHSSAFDFSVWEIWGALLTGARLVIVPYWISRSAEAFYELVVEEQVTVLNQTPSAFYQFIEAEFQHASSCGVRLVIFGGEPLDAKALLPWMQRYPEQQCRLVNMFGITETTVHVTWHDVTRQDALSGSKSVGRALPGWYCYIMNEHLELLPTGVVGEICVGGEGVSLGYHGRPELTSEKFVDDPLRPGNRLYRSGDKGRLMPDGSLEHLGRIDQQIKLRGFRIELGEIRHTLLGLPEVQGAAVLLQQPNEKDTASARLEAYLQTSCEDLTSLKQLAAQTLPDYMLPTLWHRVSEFPLTANGKLDAKALPDKVMTSPATRERALGEKEVGEKALQQQVQPIQANVTATQSAVTHSDNTAPVATENSDSPMQEKLIAIWREVLGCEVSANDNFFDLGGNSLYAMRILSELKKRNLPTFSTRELYVHQTISRLTKASAS